MPLQLEDLPKRLRELVDTAPIIQGKTPAPNEIEAQKTFKAKVKAALESQPGSTDEGMPRIGYNSFMKLVKEKQSAKSAKEKKKPLQFEDLPVRLQELIDSAPVVHGKVPTPDEREAQKIFNTKVRDAVKEGSPDGGGVQVGYNEIMKLFKAKQSTKPAQPKKKKNPFGKPKNDAYRNNRDMRRAMAEETVRILEEGQYTVVPDGFHDGEAQETKSVSIKEYLDRAIEGTYLYRPNDLSRLTRHTKPRVQTKKETRFEVVNETTLAGAKAIINETSARVCVLNFASANSPGGGFLRGAQAQEEDLAIASGLYPCLVKDWDDGTTAGNQNQTPRVYYTENHKTNDGLYTDHTIYSPDVPVFRDEDETRSFLEEPYLVSMITSPAPNAKAYRGELSKQAKWPRELPDDYWKTFQQRIRYVLRVALANGHVNLVLGAWGCGVFANDPVRVARMFAAELAAPGVAGCFERVRFSILARHGVEDASLNAFKLRFGGGEHQ